MLASVKFVFGLRCSYHLKYKFCCKIFFSEPRWSSNTACLADDVKGEAFGSLHEQQEVVHNPSIVSLISILHVIKGKHRAPELPIYYNVLVPQCPLLLSSEGIDKSQLCTK